MITRLRTPCSGSHRDQWAEDDPDAEEACLECPLFVQCARDALSIEHPEGVYAGVYVPHFVKTYNTRKGSEAKCQAAIDKLKVIANVA
jgi:hypothetical protein